MSLTTAGVLAASALAYGDGVDISHWQGTVNWTKVKAAGVEFAFMKATEGTTFVDPTYTSNAAAAQSVGIYHGAYHFARPKVGNAAEQAAYYVAKTGGRAAFQTAGMLPPVLDLEATGGLSVSRLRTWTSTWLSTVEGLTGRTPMVYCSPSFWESNLANSTAFHHYPLWIAHYGVSSPRVPGGWPSWTFWQRTSSGSVPGISGNVDMNRFSGTSAQLATLALSDGGSTDPVPPGPTLPGVDPTTLSMTATTTSTSAINAPVTFEGALRASPGDPSASPAPLPARRVTLFARDAGTSTWHSVASTTTGPDGQYAVTTPVPRTGSYQMRWAGDAAYAPSYSSVLSVRTPGRTAVTVDVHLTKTLVRRGGATMVYGHVLRAADGVAGSPVRIYKKPRYSGRWRLVARRTSLAPTGWYSVVVHPLHPRVYKAVAAATTYHLGATSGRATVRIR